MIDEYIIQVTPEGDEYLATVLKQTGYDQREGPSFKVIGVALDPNKASAIQQALDKVNW